MSALRQVRAWAAEHPVAASLGLLVLAWLVISFVPPWGDERINDFYVYRIGGEHFADGKLPYRSVAFEYPPLVAPLLALPALLGEGHESYRVLFSAMMLLVAIPVLLLTRGLASLTGGNARVAAVAFALSPLLLGAAARDHFDLAAVALMLGALVLILRERPGLGVAVLGLAAMTKVFPLVAAPIALAWLLARGDRRGAIRGALALCAVLGALAAAVVAISPDGARDAVSYHSDLPVQLESSPATVLFAIDALGAAPVHVVESFRSNGLIHPSADAVTGVFASLGVVALALLLWRTSLRPGRRELVLASLAAAAAFACFGKVLSPQFLIWTLPLIALALAWGERALAATLAAATVLTFVEFPYRYYDLVAEETFPVVVVALRNLLLIGAVALSLRALAPAGAAQHAGRRAAVAERAG